MTPPEWTQAELLQVANGDRAMQKKFIKEHTPFLRGEVERFWRSFNGSREDWVADRVQEILVHIMKKDWHVLREFKPKRGKSSTYLRTVLRSHMIVLFRKDRRLRQYLTQDGAPYLEEVADERWELATLMLEDQDLLDQLMTVMMQRLEQQELELFTKLTQINEKYTMLDLAAELKITSAALATRKTRLLAKVKELLAELLCDELKQRYSQPGFVFFGRLRRIF